MFFLLMYLFTLLPVIGYEQALSVEKTINGFRISVPIDALFTGECLTCPGQKTLLDIKDKLGDNDIFVECSTNHRLCYNASWELADIYAYKVVIFLIQNGVNPQKITYIGYGSMTPFDEEPNRIEFSVVTTEGF